MRNFLIEEKLKKKFEKLFKKDRVIYEIIMRKIEEIINIENLDHYKNLRSPLEEYKRVHIRGSFVLTFKHNVKENTITFYDFDHHDYIYQE